MPSIVISTCTSGVVVRDYLARLKAWRNCNSYGKNFIARPFKVEPALFTAGAATTGRAAKDGATIADNVPNTPVFMKFRLSITRYFINEAVALH